MSSDVEEMVGLFMKMVISFMAKDERFIRKVADHLAEAHLESMVTHAVDDEIESMYEKVTQEVKKIVEARMNAVAADQAIVQAKDVKGLDAYLKEYIEDNVQAEISIR